MIEAVREGVRVRVVVVAVGVCACGGQMLFFIYLQVTSHDTVFYPLSYVDVELFRK